MRSQYRERETRKAESSYVTKFKIFNPCELLLLYLLSQNTINLEYRTMFIT